jgi:hypothetical protein
MLITISIRENIHTYKKKKKKRGKNSCIYILKLSLNRQYSPKLLKSCQCFSSNYLKVVNVPPNNKDTLSKNKKQKRETKGWPPSSSPGWFSHLPLGAISWGGLTTPHNLFIYLENWV